MDDVVHMKAVKYPRRESVKAKPVCLQVFFASSDTEAGLDAPYRCGLSEGHEGAHAWRGDLPGGPTES